MAVRSQLLSVLREMEARGGAGLTVRIVEPEPFSPEAQEAIDKLWHEPQPVTSREGGQVQEMQVFLGVAFVSGPNEAVIPFLDRGLSPEYNEIVRALRTVTLEEEEGRRRHAHERDHHGQLRPAGPPPAAGLAHHPGAAQAVRGAAASTPAPG